MTEEQIDAIFEMPMKLTGVSVVLADDARELAYLINENCPDGAMKRNAIEALLESLRIALTAIATA